MITCSKIKKINKFDFFADGSKHQSIIIKKNDKKNLEFSMNGREVFAFTLNEVPKFINEYLKKIKKGKNFFKNFFFISKWIYFGKSV